MWDEPLILRELASPMERDHCEHMPFESLTSGQEKDGQGLVHVKYRNLVTDASGALANTAVRLRVVAVIHSV